MSMRPSRTAKNIGLNPDRSDGVDVGPGIENRVDDPEVPLGRRPHQRGLPAPLARVRIRAVGQQRLHRPETARPRRGHEDGLAAQQPDVRVGSRVEQKPHEGRVAVGGNQ